MNIFRSSLFRALTLALALPLAALVLAGCDVGSTDSTTATVSDNDGTIYNFAGLYMNPANDSGSTNGVGVLPLVYPYQDAGRRPSGELITFLRLLQYGSALEAYDSAGLTWSGSISGVQGGTAAFSLSGRTTAGQSVEIAGSLSYADQKSSMDATWIEPAYYGNLNAQATVAPSVTNSPTPTNTPNGSVTISPNGTITLSTNGASQSFTARDGDGTYSWSYVGSGGSLSSTLGNPVTFTRNSSGSGVVSVRSDDTTATASIFCP